jgi:hypothetical protein
MKFLTPAEWAGAKKPAALPQKFSAAATIALLNINSEALKGRSINRLLKQQLKAFNKKQIKFLILSETKSTARSKRQKTSNYELFTTNDRRSGVHPHPPMGGVSILVHKQYAERTDKIQVPFKNDNIIWLVVRTEKGSHILAGMYNRPWQKEHTTEEHEANMLCIEKNIKWIKEKFDPLSILMGGDFNTRLGEQTQDKTTNSYKPRFEQMIEETKLEVLLPARSNPHQNWTLLHLDTRTNRTASSIIDLFLGSPAPMFEPYPDGALSKTHPEISLGSDHRMVTCEWNIDLGDALVEWTQAVRDTIFWDETAIRAFQTAIGQDRSITEIITKLNVMRKTLNQPNHHRIPKNAITEMNKLARQLVRQTTKASENLKAAQKVRRERDHDLSGKEKSLEHKRAAIAKSISELPADDPEIVNRFEELKTVNGDIHALHTQADHKLHNKWWDQVINSLADDTEHGPDEFWRLVKRLKRSHQTSIFPSAMKHETTDTWATDMNSIMELIVEHYKAVATSTDPDGRASSSSRTRTQSTQASNHDIQEKKEAESLDATPCPRSLDPGDLKSSDLNIEEVKTATSSRKPGRRAGPMGDSYEMWKYGGDTLLEAMHALFSTMWALGSVPKCMKESTMTLIYKKGERNLVKNYRPITLMSCLLKIYEKVLETRLSSHVHTNNIISRLQNAGKRHKGAIDAMEKIKNMQEQEDRYMLLSIDLSKAFDRVPLHILFNKLSENKITGRLNRAIRSTYTTQSLRIEIGDKKSNEFSLDAGVKQGSVLSPTLFILFVNDLLRELESKKSGPLVDGIPTPAQMFVDDLILMATSQKDMTDLWAIVTRFCLRNGCVVNTSKTQILQCNMKTSAFALTQSLRLPPSTIQDKLKYLGIEISAMKGPKGWSAHVDSRMTKMQSAYFSLTANGLHWGNNSITPSLKLYAEVLTPILMYGGELWELDERTSQLLDRKQAKLLKLILGLHRMTPTPWVLWETATLPASIQADLLKVKRWRKTMVDHHNNWKNTRKTAKKRRRNGLPALHAHQHQGQRLPLTQQGRKIKTILQSWGLANKSIREIVQPRPETEPTGETDWKTWATSNAEQQHTEQFRTWAESEECLSRDLTPLAVKADRPLSHLLDGSLPIGSQNQVTNVLRLRAYTIGIGADWSRRSQSDHPCCPLCSSQNKQDSIPHMLTECRGLAKERTELILAMHKTWSTLEKTTYSTTQSATGKTLLLCRSPTAQQVLFIAHFLQEAEITRDRALESR